MEITLEKIELDLEKMITSGNLKLVHLVLVQKFM